MGADRAILVQTDDEVEPLAVAKILKAIAEEEQPGLVILGKQAIDDDCNQTGQMLAALMGRPQGTFASEVTVEGDSVTVKREVDGGLGDGEAEAAGDRHHRPASERAALCVAAQHHEGQVEADGEQDPGRLRRRYAPRLKTLKVTEPPVRQAGIKVADVDALVAKLKEHGSGGNERPGLCRA